MARKFPKLTVELDKFLSTLSFTLAYTPQIVPSGLFEIRDISDAPILYTAMIEGVDVLITGDKDFNGIEVELPAIMTISEFENEFM